MTVFCLEIGNVTISRRMWISPSVSFCTISSKANYQSTQQSYLTANYPKISQGKEKLKIQ